MGNYFFSYLLTWEVDLIEFLEIMAQRQQYIYFFKPETNKCDFRLYFELVEKSCRGRHHSEILKTNTKTLIHSIWIRPQGSLGCQKMRQGPLNTPFEVWRANIASKLKNIQNTLRKQGFFDIFFQFWQFFEVCAFLWHF